MNLYLSSKNDTLLKETVKFAKDFPDVAPISCDYIPLLTVKSPGAFQIDIKPLILGENIYIDATAFDRMHSDTHIPAKLREFCQELNAEGLIKLVDTGAIISRDRASFEQLLERDRGEIQSWLGLYQGYRAHLLGHDESRRSLDLKETDFDRTFLLFDRIFTRTMIGYAERFHPQIEHLLAYFPVDPTDPYVDLNLTPELMRTGQDLLQPFLEYLNSNLIIASRLKADVYDWKMMRPAYELKMRNIGTTLPSVPGQAQKLDLLFELFFPDLDLAYPSVSLRDLMNGLTKRNLIEELRKVVQQAAQGMITLDQNYVHATVRSILGSQASAENRNSIISWLSCVGGLIGDVLLGHALLGFPAASMAGKAVEEVGKKLNKKDHWYFLFHSNT
jgi:hypothetical protein